MADNLYKEVSIKAKKETKPPVAQRSYPGFPTVNPESTTFQLFDCTYKTGSHKPFIRQGEKLSDPISDVLSGTLFLNL